LPVGGSVAFAVGEGHALFRGGYKARDVYHLFSLGATGEIELATKLELLDQAGKKLFAERVVGRADVLHIVSGGYLYSVDVQTAIAA
jgi:hypothetical protein